MGYDADDPRLAALHAKARTQNALLAAYGALVAAYALVLVMSERGPFDARAFAIASGVFIVIVPALCLKGWARARFRAGMGVTAASVGAGAFAATLSPLWTAVAVALGLAGAYAFYRIAANTAYRPRLLQSAVDKALLAPEGDTI